MASELRQDLVSGDWVAIAPNRAKRPEQFIKKEKRVKAALKSCPFEDLEKSGNGKSILEYGVVKVITNKYSAFIHRDACAHKFKTGPYLSVEGIGYHELVVTADHNKNFPNLKKEDSYLVFKAFHDRYQKIAKDKCLAYVSIFHNWGPRAGASIYHPHYQIIGIPVIPPDIEHSLDGSRRYYKKNKKCVHCVMIEWEKKEKKRIVYENDGAIAFAPFVSREPFELRVFPKHHLPYFESSPESDVRYVIDALRESLGKIEKNLQDPDYNFFIHTSPVINKRGYQHYHWHIEVLPKFSISAGFELGTGVEITVIDPDEAAKILRK